MKTSRSTSQTAMEGQANRVFRQAEGVSPEDCKQEEGSIGRGGRMVDRRVKLTGDVSLKTSSNGEIPVPDQKSKLGDPVPARGASPASGPRRTSRVREDRDWRTRGSGSARRRGGRAHRRRVEPARGRLGEAGWSAMVAPSLLFLFEFWLCHIQDPCLVHHTRVQRMTALVAAPG
jgi:hypothetical protein